MSEQQQSDVYYFAFGANMATRVLTGRRKVHPKESHPCYVNNFELSFCMKGVPYFEPSFASIQEKDKAIVHGVVHLITREDMDQIRRTEGGNGHDNVGYKEIIVEANIYSSSDRTSYRKVNAIALQACKIDIVDALPSARYLNILREGAKEFNLDETWIHYLEKELEPYKTRNIWQNFGKWIFALGCIPFLILPGLVMFSSHLFKFKVPYFMVWYMQSLGSLVWSVHDWVYAPIFGSGKNNGKKNKEKQVK
ncbi:hypothetical protein ABK040_004987 [Willaertia magna]